jgi:hypothetical protein
MLFIMEMKCRDELNLEISLDEPQAVSSAAVGLLCWKSFALPS